MNNICSNPDAVRLATLLNRCKGYIYKMYERANLSSRTEDKEDFFQDVCVRCLVKMEKYSHPAWKWKSALVMRCAYRLLLRKIEKFQQEPLVESDAALMDVPDRCDTNSGLGADTVAVLLRGLNDQIMRALSAHLLEGKNFREIADESRLPESTVKSSYYRSLKKLRNRFSYNC